MPSSVQLRLATALVVALPVSLAAQTPVDPGVTIRVKARAVLTDVLVQDKKGNPVVGLPETAFHLTEDGRPQHLSSFTEHTASTDPSPAPANLGAGTYTSDTSQFPSVLNILVIDTLSLSFVDQMFLAYQLERFVAMMPANLSIAVYLRAGDHTVQLQGLTSDHAKLLRAIHEALPHLPRILVSPEQEVETLHQIASDLGRVPGRKNVIWLTGTINPPFTLSALESGHLEAGLRIAYDELQTARVAVYPVDARGLVVNDAPSMFLSRKLMEDVAEATGGTAIYNNNGIAQQAIAIATAGVNFYTLTYTPQSFHFDGRWHSVRVEVDGKYHLSYRHGYYADDSRRLLPETPRVRLGVLGNSYQENPADRLRPVVFTAKVTLEVQQGSQRAPAPGQTRYAVELAVSPDGFRRSLSGGKSEIRLRLAVLAMNKYGALLTSIATEHDYDVDEEKLRQHPEARIPATQLLDLNPGDTYLYVVVWDPLNERAGTLSIPLEVPKTR